jgi:hypothetical protein
MDFSWEINYAFPCMPCPARFILALKDHNHFDFRLIIANLLIIMLLLDKSSLLPIALSLIIMRQTRVNHQRGGSPNSTKA